MELKGNVSSAGWIKFLDSVYNSQKDACQLTAYHVVELVSSKNYKHFPVFKSVDLSKYAHCH